MDLKNIHNVYFIGIGGIGMSALARYFVSTGKQVAGYDKTFSTITNALKDLGIAVHIDDNLDKIPECFFNPQKTLVVYTPAIPSSHNELNYFINNNYTVLKRSEVLGYITKNTFCLAVAGTHGKTTTSSILGHIMQPYGATSFLGGVAENYQSNLILGDSKISVVEADEFDRSFLQLAPNIACITSMDADHLDIYGDKSSIEASFNDFASKVSNTLIVAKGLPLEGKTYAVEQEADYAAVNLKIIDGWTYFDVLTPKEKIANVRFLLPGKHNLMNALAALAIAYEYGISSESIKKSLETFVGVQRRFSYKIKSDNFVLIDDYAHHPTEIEAVYHAVRELYSDEKIMVVFQPHLFSRTQDFADDFARVLSKFDYPLLLDIYPAREKPIEGVTSSWLLEKMTATTKKMVTKEEVLTEIKNTSAKIVVMLGAGDIGVLIEDVSRKLKQIY